MESLGEDDPRRDDIKQIQLAGTSATALTRQLLAFSRRQILAPQILDLNTLVNRLQPMLRRLIGEHIVLEVVVDPALLRINADPGQIEQVLMNLAVNAKDAMPMSGRLRIDTAMVELDEAFVATHPGATSGHHVRLSVTDNGIGMEPDVLAHLFEPFFTTKDQGKGTGLGLATVYGIVKQSGGYAVQSAPRHGKTFRSNFPRGFRGFDCAERDASSGPTGTENSPECRGPRLEVRQISVCAGAPRLHRPGRRRTGRPRSNFWQAPRSSGPFIDRHRDAVYERSRTCHPVGWPRSLDTRDLHVRLHRRRDHETRCIGSGNRFPAKAVPVAAVAGPGARGP